MLYKDGIYVTWINDSKGLNIFEVTLTQDTEVVFIENIKTTGKFNTHIAKITPLWIQKGDRFKFNHTNYEVVEIYADSGFGVNCFVDGTNTQSGIDLKELAESNITFEN